ncbi:protease modulator HflC [Paraurantiacibacter namhicola]|uniref:Protein HflC n=1 Tax=Paraurantiacibacter namhicola TaxID=645517 RepID=A0A1C7D731_9SPHN|nr:protease modulator HflC [Paraurantiacibacter namhicola]ANU07131.1 Modulator of FtsH protease HflC [Paraurantiacibacter namhicola]
MENIWNNHRASVLAVLGAIVIGLTTLIVVPETQQAVIIRAGQPDRVANMYRPDVEFGDTGAGIVARIPFYERVQFIDKRVMNLDMPAQQVITSDQQRVVVDAYARFRVVNPVTMVETAGTVDQVTQQLESILVSTLRQELGRRSFASLLTAERGTAMQNVTAQLDRAARSYGVQIVDVRIKSADLPEGTPLDSAFRRMRSERQEEAETIRAQGRRDAQIIRAEAEGEAARIYADAYNQDPNFFDFWRAMESYRRTFDEGGGESSIILSPDNEYLRQFRGRQ